MAVSLYTVRVVLDVLGTEDYGIYNVIGGIVALFSFLGGTMSSATQRFLSFEMGKEESVTPRGDAVRRVRAGLARSLPNASGLSKVFSVSVYTYILLVGVVLLLSETVGLWFVNNRLTIPEARLEAANFVYQSTILSFSVTLLCIPYNASVIAMERMNVFAYSGIVDALLRLGIAAVLPFIAADHLEAYAVLSFLAVASVQLYYPWYCRRHFGFCRYKGYREPALFRKMLSFAGLNMIGALANILRGQGLNILINLFFSPVVNAAYGVAMQVNNALTNFTNNFYTAVRPQLVKLCAEGKGEEMLELGYRSSRFAFHLMLVISMPILAYTQEILGVWLKSVPDYSVVFLRIVIVSSLVEVLSVPLVNMLQASGKIRTYQLTVSVMYLSVIPVSYVFLYWGYRPEVTLWVNLSLVVLSMFPRLYICKKVIGLSAGQYVRKVMTRVCLCSGIIALLFYSGTRYHLSANVFLALSIQLTLAGLVILFIGMERSERHSIYKQIIKHIC